MIQQEGKKMFPAPKTSLDLRNYLVFHLVWWKVPLSVARVE